MGQTRLLSCVTTSAVGFCRARFTPADEELPVTIISDVHDYGVEHYISIGSESAKYSARGQIKFHKGDRTLLKNRGLTPEQTQFRFVHRQFLAFLFNMYRNRTEDSSMDLDLLNSIQLHFTAETGPKVFVLALNGEAAGRSLWTLSMRHKTTFTAKIPKGQTALRFAGIFFRASTGLKVTGPDLWNFYLPKGENIEKESTMWLEQSRTLNWVTLLAVTLSGIVLLLILRLLLKPIGIVEIADIYVDRLHGDESIHVAEGKHLSESGDSNEVRLSFSFSDSTENL